MSNTSRGADLAEGRSAELADLVDQLTARAQAGALLEPNALAAEFPKFANELRGLLPALGLLGDLSRSLGPSVDGGGYGVPFGVVGDFRLTREVGRGGMGVVYEAEQVSLRRRVALKVLPLAAVMDTRQLQRFKNEALAAASLDHRHVVKVYAVGEDRGVHYIAMQFIAGRTLADLIRERRNGPVVPTQVAGGNDPTGSMDLDAVAGTSSKPGPTPPAKPSSRTRSDAVTIRQAAEWGIQAAEGLEHAHAVGIVHRDVKPGNLLLDGAGVLYVADFGLAKLSADPGLTEAGALLGTVRYMSPEQASAKHGLVDHRSDVYSLGVTLYELITLTPAFDGQSCQDVLSRVISDEPARPRRLDRRIPRELETVVLKAMAKDPAHRYQSAAELADDLRRFLNHEPVRATRPSVFRRTRKWVRRHRALTAVYAVSAVAVAALLSLGFWFSAQVGEARGKTAAAEAEATAAEAESRRTREVAATHAYHRVLADLREQQTRPRPGWAADGLDGIRQLVEAGLPHASRAAEIRTEAVACLTAADLGQPREAVVGVQASAVAFHPDGRWVAVAQSKAASFALCSVFLVDPATGATVHHLAFPPSQDFQLDRKVQDGPRSVAVSPDGRWLVVGARSGMLHRWDLGATEPTATSWGGHSDGIGQLVFASDGSALFSASTDGSVKRWPVATWEESASWCGPGRVRTLALLPEGDNLVCRHESEEDTIVLSTDSLEPSAGPWRLGGVRFAAGPEVVPWAVAEGPWIRILDARLPTGRPLRTLRVPDGDQAHEGTVESLAISPDGAFLASGSNDDHVRVWDMVSGRLLVDLAADLAETSPLAWHPGSRTLAVAAAGRVLLYDLCGTEFLTSVPGSLRATGVAWSPDGHTLAGAGLDADLRLWDAGGLGSGRVPATRGRINTGPQLSLSPGSLAFSPDGSQLSLLTASQVVVVDAARGEAASDTPVSGVKAIATGADGRLWAATDEGVSSWDSPGGKPGPGWSNATSRTLTGKGSINCVSAGRRWVVGGGRDGVARLIRQSDARLAASWPVGSGIECVTLSGDELLVAVGNDAGELRLARVPGGEVVCQAPRAHRETVTSVVFVTDRLLASGSQDRTIRLWTWADGTLAEVLTLRTTGRVISLAASPDGTMLAAAIQGEFGLRVWSLGRLRDGLARLNLDPGLPEFPLALPAAPRPRNGLLEQRFRGPLAVEREDRPGWLEVRAEDGGTSFVRGTGWLKAPESGAYVLTAWGEEGIRVWLDGALLLDCWNTNEPTASAEVKLTGKPQHVRVEHRERMFKPGRVLFWERGPPTGTGGVPIPTAYLFQDQKSAEEAYVPVFARIPYGREIRSFKGVKRMVLGLAVSPDGSRIAVAEEGGLWLWDSADSRSPLASLMGRAAHAGPVWGVSFSPSGGSLASVGPDRAVRVWDTTALRPLATHAGLTSNTISVAWSPDGRWIASGESDPASRLRLRDAVTGKETRGWGAAPPEFSIASIAWSPDNSRLAVATLDKNLALLGVKGADVAATLSSPVGLHRVAWSDDGRWVGAVSLPDVTKKSGFLVLWDEPAQKLVGLLRVSPERATGLAFSPDGRSLVTSGHGPLRLWDVHTGQELARFGEPDDVSRCVCITPDGRYILAGGIGRLATIRMWEIPDGVRNRPKR